MSTVNSAPDTSHAALNAAAGFLLTLNAGLGGDNANAQMFSKFLSQSQGDSLQTVPTKNNVAVSSHNASPTNNDATTARTPSLPVLRNLVSAWRHVVEKLQGQTKPVQSKQQDASVTDSKVPPPKDPRTDAAVAAQNAPAPAPTPASTSRSTSAPTTDDATDVTNEASQPTIADILKELQALALLIQQQLQALTPASASSTSGTTGVAGASASPVSPNAGGVTDPLDANDPSQSMLGAALNVDPLTALLDPSQGTAGATTDPTVTTTAALDDTASHASAPTLTQALTDLLTLVQLVAKKLEESTPVTSLATSPNNTSASTVPAASTVSSAWPSDAQLKADLKVLLDTLRSTVTAKDVNATGAGIVNTGSASNSASSTDTSNLPAQAPEASRTAWMQQDDLLSMFKPNYNQTPNTQGPSTLTFTPVVAAASGAVADTSGKGGPSLDLDLNSQSDNAAASSGALDTTSATASAGSASVTTPYSFASQLSDTRASTGGATGLPSVVDQVILQLNRNVKTGNDQMTLQLNPAELGRVSIKLDISADGKVQGTVVADNPATLNLLLKDVRGLERALQDAGLRADSGSLQFNLSGQSQQQAGQQMPGNFSSNSNTPSSSHDTSLPDITSDLSTLSADTTETYYLTPGRVNMRV